MSLFSFFYINIIYYIIHVYTIRLLSGEEQIRVAQEKRPERDSVIQLLEAEVYYYYTQLPCYITRSV